MFRQVSLERMIIIGIGRTKDLIIKDGVEKIEKYIKIRISIERSIIGSIRKNNIIERDITMRKRKHGKSRKEKIRKKLRIRRKKLQQAINAMPSQSMIQIYWF